MLEGLYCPDGKKIKLDDCLKQCRMGQRCLTLPTLYSVSYQRKWVGKPSTTQSINGTRYEMLKILEPYFIDPRDRAFALLGTRHHWRLEGIAKKLAVLPEETLEDEDTRGTLDLLEPDNNCDYEAYILSDYKTAGSYKVAKALGLQVRKVPSTTEVYRTSGKWGKAGDLKIVKEFYSDPDKVDMWDWEMQLNDYRIKVEPCGFLISLMQIQATVRDGGTLTAKQRGITENIYLIPVKRLEDEMVREYFARKSQALIEAIKTGYAPVCNEQERWDDKRCLNYCEVWKYCDYGLSLKPILDEN
jgi:hypothetical protein